MKLRFAHPYDQSSPPSDAVIHSGDMTLQIDLLTALLGVIGESYVEGVAKCQTCGKGGEKIAL